MWCGAVTGRAASREEQVFVDCECAEYGHGWRESSGGDILSGVTLVRRSRCGIEGDWRGFGAGGDEVNTEPMLCKCWQVRRPCGLLNLKVLEQLQRR